LRLTYNGTELKQRYIPDFLCYEKIILEIKAVKQLTDEHRAQVLNYLKATGLRLGLLVNFGHYPKVEYERIIL
jgi:GxxExxY protein